MKITSSSCAPSNVPRIASDTTLEIAFSSTGHRADSPSMVSANSAKASRLAPPSSGIAGSRVLF